MPNRGKILLSSAINLPSPSTINYNWNYGSLLGAVLVLQVLSGFMISMHYTSSVNEAFDSVVHISRDVMGGWFMRVLHINGASLFFLMIYCHIAKNILNSSWKLWGTWSVGVIIFIVLMATAFLGYVLPWGQMSYWAATVITNLLSTIPFWGEMIVIWLWGGFSVGGPTLVRFFSLHFLLPFVIIALSMVHMLMLHITGSSNPISINMDKDKIQFHPYFTSKDIVSLFLVFLGFLVVCLVSPYISTDPENFIPANPLSTPTHIQPEWYFLFAYAILRSIPNKLGGVIALLLSVVVLLVKPLQVGGKKTFKFSPFMKITSLLFFHSFIVLTWIGMQQVEYPFDLIGSVYSFLYFLLILLI